MHGRREKKRNGRQKELEPFIPKISLNFSIFGNENNFKNIYIYIFYTRKLIQTPDITLLWFLLS